MRMSKSVRQFHRWVSAVFTAGVIANIVAIMGLDPSKQAQPALWVYLLALVPLGLLLATGLYLFLLPYAAGRRSGRATLQRSA